MSEVLITEVVESSENLVNEVLKSKIIKRIMIESDNNVIIFVSVSSIEIEYTFGNSYSNFKDFQKELEKNKKKIKRKPN